MPKKQIIAEDQLGALAKQYRLAAGKNRTEAAKDFGVARPAIIYAEDHPQTSFLKLRKRMIEMYSPYQVEGPFYVLKKK